MAMPASGKLGVITCPDSIACTSIAQAVSGNVTPPKSLCALSVSAGKTAPHAMTEFYNYNPTKAVYFDTISSIGEDGVDVYVCKCSCLQAAGRMAVGDCFNAAFCWNINKPATIGPEVFAVRLLCNSIIICSCVVTTKSPAEDYTGTFALRCYDYNDTIHVETEVSTVEIPANAEVTLCSLTNVVGSYCIGFPSSAYSYTYGL